MKMVDVVNRDERMMPNPAGVNCPDAGGISAGEDALAFHRRLPGYAPSPLLDAPGVAEKLGAASVLVKLETERFGLPAFKILGASWATYRACLATLESRGLPADAKWTTLDDLAEIFAPLKPMTLCCATDGNHGRAVARMARWLGFSSHIFVPDDMSAARMEAIRGEGAWLTVVDGTYDDAIALSAAEANEQCLVISDASWPGYRDVPQWVIEGYTTIGREVEEQLAERGSGEAGPDLVAIQIGVGALAAAVVRAFKGPGVTPLPTILGVEPASAACALAALEAGEIVQVPGPHDSIMAGLNCGVASEVAWPALVGGIDAFVAVKDDRARDAMRWLAMEGIVAGETGAAGLAGLIAWREAFGGDLSGKRVLLIVTEGATDPESYARVVGEAG